MNEIYDFVKSWQVLSLSTKLMSEIEAIVVKTTHASAMVTERGTVSPVNSFRKPVRAQARESTLNKLICTHNPSKYLKGYVVGSAARTRVLEVLGKGADPVPFAVRACVAFFVP